ncbi:unnamed protein product [Moneuplotes crassus]|uniref:RBR-type E3 ubiquitin transferase n=1 Tax=Euplotes crassus TaxID=5936 RepID=A0AAD2D004_EUPCR|nr:unnamed protein product [Moneuplotes crassus]
MKFGDLSDKTVTLECKHTFCYECLRQHFSHQIRRKVLQNTCPSCHRAVSEDLAQTVLSSADIGRLLSFKRHDMVDKDTDLYWCPQPGCKLYVRAPGVKPGTAHKATCECGHTFCTGCHEAWHEGKSCRKFQVRRMGTLVNNKVVKPCPKCDTLIEKNQGCDHMTCSVCKYEFWWTTGERYGLFQRPQLQQPEAVNGREVMGLDSLAWVWVVALFPVLPFYIIWIILGKFSNENNCQTNFCICIALSIYLLFAILWIPFCVAIYAVYIVIIVIGVIIAVLVLLSDDDD